MNMQYPFIPRPMPYHTPNLEEEILKLKHELKELKERITRLEQENKPNYLQKDDSLYMMWTFTRSFFVAESSFMLY